MRFNPVTLSTALWSNLSKLSSTTSPTDPPEQREAMRHCTITRRSLGVVELALPATALLDDAVARWAKARAVAVEARDSADLMVAVGTGIDPMLMTAHTGGLSSDESVFCVANLGVGRIVVSGADQVDLLAAVGRAGQRVLVALPQAGLATRVLDCATLDLVGLYGEIDSCADNFAGYAIVVGDLLVEMAQIRRAHGAVLTRIALGGCRLTFGAGPGDLSEVANVIDETLDDACATLRFPRPAVVVSAQPASSRHSPVV